MKNLFVEFVKWLNKPSLSERFESERVKLKRVVLVFDNGLKREIEEEEAVKWHKMLYTRDFTDAKNIKWVESWENK